MSRQRVTVEELTEAADTAVELSKLVNQPTVVVGGFALAAHGFIRETGDVDVIFPIVMKSEECDVLQAAAISINLNIKAKHSFGGFDLRADDNENVRVDVLTLDREIPELVPAAVEEAVSSNRKITLFGHKVYCVSVGYLITLKLLSSRTKDLGDIVELIKVRMEDDKWVDDYRDVAKVVRQFLGLYAVHKVDDLAKKAREELGI